MFGVGCKVFSITGPVILYGIVTSFLCGLVYWVLKILGAV
ncbi:MAG: SpoVA/SpoVAEb family sporulation membrane protein [Lachnospiraceae bacterium]|nr:SpoVA/SpoVAEb family sporulation membrane protein [Lachnospiraceae bacterium]